MSSLCARCLNCLLPVLLNTSFLIVAIGEELGFDDVFQDEAAFSSRRSTRSASIKSHDSDDGIGPGHRTQRFPTSPGGSLESSSVISRGSDAGRSFLSRRSYDR